MKLMMVVYSGVVVLMMFDSFVVMDRVVNENSVKGMVLLRVLMSSRFC